MDENLPVCSEHVAIALPDLQSTIVMFNGSRLLCTSHSLPIHSWVDWHAIQIPIHATVALPIKRW